MKEDSLLFFPKYIIGNTLISAYEITPLHPLPPTVVTETEGAVSSAIFGLIICVCICNILFNPQFLGRIVYRFSPHF